RDVADLGTRVAGDGVDRDRGAGRDRAEARADRQGVDLTLRPVSAGADEDAARGARDRRVRVDVRVLGHVRLEDDDLAAERAGAGGAADGVAIRLLVRARVHVHAAARRADGAGVRDGRLGVRRDREDRDRGGDAHEAARERAGQRLRLDVVDRADVRAAAGADRSVHCRGRAEREGARDAQSARGRSAGRGGAADARASARQATRELLVRRVRAARRLTPVGRVGRRVRGRERRRTGGVVGLAAERDRVAGVVRRARRPGALVVDLRARQRALVAAAVAGCDLVGVRDRVAARRLQRLLRLDDRPGGGVRVRRGRGGGRGLLRVVLLAAEGDDIALAVLRASGPVALRLAAAVVLVRRRRLHADAPHGHRARGADEAAADRERVGLHVLAAQREPGAVVLRPHRRVHADRGLDRLVEGADVDATRDADEPAADAAGDRERLRRVDRGDVDGLRRTEAGRVAIDGRVLADERARL